MSDQLALYGAVWERWPAGLVKLDGRIRPCWMDPDPANRIRVSEAQARRIRRLTGQTKGQAPAGDWISVVVDGGLGWRVVPVAALRHYDGPRVRPPVVDKPKRRRE